MRATGTGGTRALDTIYAAMCDTMQMIWWNTDHK